MVVAKHLMLVSRSGMVDGKRGKVNVVLSLMEEGPQKG